MADHEWLMHLAAARWEGGQWVAFDRDAVAAQLERRLAGALDELMAAAEESSQILAELSDQRLRIKVLPLQRQANAVGDCGFLLLLGRCQITVAFAPPYLQTTLVTVAGFERKARSLHRFTPEADSFGTLSWRLDNALLMGGELIIKRLFEALTRAAHEAGDIPTGG